MEHPLLVNPADRIWKALFNIHLQSSGTDYRAMPRRINKREEQV